MRRGTRMYRSRPLPCASGGGLGVGASDDFNIVRDPVEMNALPIRICPLPVLPMGRRPKCCERMDALEQPPLPQGKGRNFLLRRKSSYS
jgi:hypothetical protein